jgi:hypothetical protein
MLLPDFVWHNHSKAEQQASLLPLATLEWASKTRPAISPFLKPEKKKKNQSIYQHSCVFQPCSNYQFCLGANCEGTVLLLL